MNASERQFENSQMCEDIMCVISVSKKKMFFLPIMCVFKIKKLFFDDELPREATAYLLGLA